MFQGYSSNLTVAANTAFPFNNTVIDKGCAETLSAPSSIQLNKRGVYLIKVDGYATGSEAATGSVQLYANGVAQPQAISEFALAAGDVASFGFSTVIKVVNNNCPCNAVASPTILQLMNGDSAITNGHVNILITRLC